ncbi:MAG TPA: hypothetical protein VGG09_06450 [Acidimicrobiales bacterium]
MSPWTRTDALIAAVVMAIGGVVCFAGWWEVSTRASMAEQIMPLDLAIVGLVVIGAGQVLWFLRGRRAVHTRRWLLLGTAAAPRRAATVIAGDDRLAGTERFYHRLDCPMVDDRPWGATSRAAHEASGRIPCGVCIP